MTDDVKVLVKALERSLRLARKALAALDRARTAPAGTGRAKAANAAWDEAHDAWEAFEDEAGVLIAMQKSKP